MIDPRQLRERVIRPALDAIGLGGEAAEILLLGTAIQESGLVFLAQLGGPALGLWQMEPATHEDCWANFITGRDALHARINNLLTNQPVLDQLVTNLAYACAMARIKYYRDPAPIPAADDAAGMAAFYKRVYNSALGAADLAEAELAFRRAIAA